MSQRPIEAARRVTGIEPVSLLESWNEKNLEVAFWSMPAPRMLKFATANHFATFAIRDVDNQILLDANSKHLRTGPIKAGRFRLAQGPAEFTTELTSRTPVEMLNIYFSTRLVHQIAGDLGHRPKAVVLRDPLWDEQDELLEKLAFSVVEDLKSNSLGDRLFAQETVMLILHRLLLKYSDLSERRAVAEPSLSHDYRWAVEFMSDNIDKSVSIDQLAALANTTTFGFIRGFNKVYGATPMRYLRQLRLERAKEMLVHTSLPIAAVSHRLGFSDAAHFITAFKREAGITPRAYRLASTKARKRKRGLTAAQT